MLDGGIEIGARLSEQIGDAKRLLRHEDDVGVGVETLDGIESGVDVLADQEKTVPGRDNARRLLANAIFLTAQRLGDILGELGAVSRRVLDALDLAKLEVGFE